MEVQVLIEELGIDKLPEEKQKPLLATIFRTLEKRVSLRLATTWTDEQAEQFARLASQDDEAAGEELAQQFPEFKQIFSEEVENLRNDLRAISPQQ